MKRRDFLRLTGTFFASASIAGLPGCGGGDDAPAPDAGGALGLYAFPQGVASGDPRETSVVLWTRAVAATGATDTVALTVEVSADADFATIVVQQALQATAASDHTVRVVVTELAADTVYHYRFIAGDDVIVGRTRTAPAANADVTVRLAWVSCQEYTSGTYDAYRQMIVDDEALPEADQIRAVLHLGDFIYETRGAQYQLPLDEDLAPTTVVNRDGSPRALAPFPSGGGAVGSATYARTIEDYRHLYKTYASDPDLRAARARWPFIHTWDDHEFSNDCWQSQANYDDGDSADEPAQRRKVAANQAWFEFIPVQLTGAPGVPGVAQDARDFAPTTVEDAAFTAADDANFVAEPNNVAAIASMTIYRSFRFGRHIELVMTDQRSYRSDHAVPEELASATLGYFDTRMALPADDVATLDAGRTANDGHPPERVGLSGLPNPRIDSPVGTMLGAAQKAWWKATMVGSDATWKLWGNEVPFMRYFIKGEGSFIVDRVMDGDGWDGYPTERAELTTYLREQGVGNLIVLTGDIHAHFAGIVHDDYLAASPVPVGVELAAAGVSSNSLFSFFEYAARPQGIPADVRRAVSYDASATDGPRHVENLNLLLLHGTAAATTMGLTNDLEQAMAVADPTVNPHLKYADTNAQGYGIAVISGAQVEATLVTMARPVATAAPAVLRTARFVVPVDDPGAMTGPTITGARPFPLG